MKIEVTMPQMGESIAEGTIIRWLKQVGDPIHQDETLLEISTDKVDSEIPSPASGVIAELLVAEGETVEVGKVIAYIETEAGVEIEAPLPKKEEQPVLEKGEVRTPSPAGEEVVSRPAGSGERAGKIFLSPLVKKIARENQISTEELMKIPGTGKDGRVTRDDLLDYLKQRKGAPAVPPEIPKPVTPPTVSITPEYRDERVEVVRMDHIRRAIAEHMVRSVQTSPHVVTFAEVDMTRIVNLREKVKTEFEEKYGFKLTYTAFFVETTAQALKEFPYLNASVEGDKIVLKKYYNIGVAVAVGQNLIVPVIKNADQKNLIGIARAVHELTEKARTKRLLPDDVQDGTFSITNPGIFGNTVGMAIINQPQVAILDCGAIVKRPVVVHDAIAIRPIMWLSLSYDHRIIDGAMASRFTQRLVQLLENYHTENII